MVLKYYYDFLSQPSRAVFIFLKLTKIPFEPCPVALRKREHLTEEFKRDYSRFQKVPFIHDNGFKLSESVAIFRYLVREYPTEDHWYPKDTKERAKVDEYLEWQHLNIRFFCATYFLVQWLLPVVTEKPASPQKIERAMNDMLKSLDKFEELFLSEGPFINGFQHMTFADILAACEIEQTRMVGFEPTEDRTKLDTWLKRVRKECNPYYDDAHQIVEKIAKKPAEGFDAKL